MFDPTKLVSPRDIVIEKLDLNLNRALLDKDNTRVRHIQSNTGVYNTGAIVDEYTDATVTVPVRIGRELVYNRVDIEKCISELSFVQIDKDGQETYSIYTDSLYGTLRNIKSDALCDFLNEQYDIPLKHTDLEHSEILQFSAADTVLGPLYNKINCELLDSYVAYTSGDVVVNHVPEIYSNATNTVCNGCMLVREWKYGEELRLSPDNLADLNGWTIMLETVDDLLAVSNSNVWLKLVYNTLNQAWNVIADGVMLKSLPANVDAVIGISAFSDGLVVKQYIDAQEVSSDNVPTTSVTKNRGIMRITAYTTNPYPGIFRIKAEVVSDSSTTPAFISSNTKVYGKPYTLIRASGSSNAAVGSLTKPVMLTSHRGENYSELEDTLFSPTFNKRQGALGTVISFEKYKEQTVNFNLYKNNSVYSFDDIKTMSLTLFNNLNISQSYRVDITPVTTTEGTTITVKTTKNDVLVANVTKPIDSDMLFKVVMSPNKLEIHQGDVKLSEIIVPSPVESISTLKYRIRCSITAKSDKMLPEIELTQNWKNINEL